MKRFTYSDSVAGMQAIEFNSLSTAILYIERFYPVGDSEGVVFQDGEPILMYCSIKDELTWKPIAN